MFGFERPRYFGQAAFAAAVTANLPCLLRSAAIHISCCKLVCFKCHVVRGKQESLSMAQNKSRHLTPIDWVICGVACFGFAFDTYELLALTLTVQPALTEFLTARPGSAGVQSLDRLDVLHSRHRRRNIRFAGRIPDRSVRPPPRLVLEHSAVLFFHAGHGVFIFRPATADLSLHHFRRRIGRIRRGHSLARRTVSRKEIKEKPSSASRRFSPPPEES